MQIAGVGAGGSGAEIAGIDHGDVHAEARQIVRGGAAIDAGTDHQDVGLGQYEFGTHVRVRLVAGNG